MFAIETTPASREEGIMLTFQKCMQSIEPVIINGERWYHKKSMMQAHPQSTPTAYKQMGHISTFFQTKKIGSTVYLRVDDSIDWRTEMMAGAISVNDMSELNKWDSISKVMRNSLEMISMLNQIESYVSLSGSVFLPYDGIVKDIQKQLKEQARINSRLQRAFKRIGDA